MIVIILIIGTLLLIYPYNHIGKPKEVKAGDLATLQIPSKMKVEKWTELDYVFEIKKSAIMNVTLTPISGQLNLYSDKEPNPDFKVLYETLPISKKISSGDAEITLGKSSYPEKEETHWKPTYFKAGKCKNNTILYSNKKEHFTLVLEYWGYLYKDEDAIRLAKTIGDSVRILNREKIDQLALADPTGFYYDIKDTPKESDSSAFVKPIKSFADFATEMDSITYDPVSLDGQKASSEFEILKKSTTAVTVRSKSTNSTFEFPFGWDLWLEDNGGKISFLNQTQFYDLFIGMYETKGRDFETFKNEIRPELEEHSSKQAKYFQVDFPGKDYFLVFTRSNGQFTHSYMPLSRNVDTESYIFKKTDKNSVAFLKVESLANDFDDGLSLLSLVNDSWIFDEK